MLDFWRLYESGLFYKKELQFNSDSNPPQASAPGIVRHFAEGIFCLTRLYAHLLSDSDVVKLSLTIFGTRGRMLVWDNLQPVFWKNYQANRPSILVEASNSLADWRAGIEDHSVELASRVFRYFQLESPDNQQMRKQIRRLFERELM
jgi:hypothetical protein